MKASYWVHLSSARPFVRLLGDGSLSASIHDQRSGRQPLAIGTPDRAVTPVEASNPLKLLSKGLLIFPAFIVIVLMVAVFLSISWSIRAGQLLLPRVKSLLNGRTP